MADEPKARTKGNRTVAVVDVGSNSVRLLVARQLSDAAFEVVDEERYDARIGEGQRDGVLTPEGIERGLRGIEVMMAVARSHQPSNLVIVGTEALRRASNAEILLDAARAASGAEIRVLSGEEEATAAFLGVANSTLLRDGFVVDIGGGSLEVVAVSGRELRSVQSAPLGAIYATERYFKSDPPSQRDVRALRAAVRARVSIEAGGRELYGTGGAVRSLGRLVRLRREYPLRRLHGLVVSRREVHRLASVLTKATPDQRRQMPGLGSNRVNSLPAAAIVIDEVMDCLGTDTLTVAGQGLREGIAWQMLRPGHALLDDVRAASIDGLARANGVTNAEASPVAAAACLLFDATAKAHGLDAAERELLGFAAQLSGIGMHVDYYNRDRHAEYLVHSGDLRGFSHREIVLLAALVRWAERGTPDLAPYRSLLQPEDPRRAAVMAALLGVARAIYRRGSGAVGRLEARADRERLTLDLAGADELAPELLAIEGQTKRFESIVGLRLASTSGPSISAAGERS